MPNEIDLSILGDSGLKRYSGKIVEEWLRKLSGTQAIKIYTEMRDNDATIGAILFVIEMLCRQVEWTVESASMNTEDTDNADFIKECMGDMSHTWEDLISEILSMLPFGWSYFEIMYKYRGGPWEGDPTKRSEFKDGKLGWRKICLRAQESLDRWEFDDDGGVRGMHQYLMYASGKSGSVFIPIEKALLFRTKAHKNNPEGRSIFRNAYISWYYLKRIMEIEAIGVERDLAGLPDLQVPPDLLNPNASAAEKELLETLKTYVCEIRRDEREAMIRPAEEITIGEQTVKTGYKFGLVQSGGKRQFDTSAIVQRYKQEIAAVVLMEFILLGMDKVGSFSMHSSKVNLATTALNAWLNSIAAVFNRYAIPRLLYANGVKSEKLPKIKPGAVQDVSLEEFATAIRNVSSGGMPLTYDIKTENHIRRRLNLPAIEEEKL